MPTPTNPPANAHLNFPLSAHCHRLCSPPATHRVHLPTRRGCRAQLLSGSLSRAMRSRYGLAMVRLRTLQALRVAPLEFRHLITRADTRFSYKRTMAQQKHHPSRHLMCMPSTRSELRFSLARTCEHSPSPSLSFLSCRCELCGLVEGTVEPFITHVQSHTADERELSKTLRMITGDYSVHAIGVHVSDCLHPHTPLASPRTRCTSRA
jgi:hypothetical protein